MILRIIDYIPFLKKCTNKKVHFFTLFFALFFLLFTLETSAHAIMLSVCKLKYEQDGWNLYFQQKTRPLRDAIYTIRADLKGINLNSEIFLNETSQYINNSLTLKNKGKLLKITPKSLKYNGLKFEGQFSVEDLPKNPDDLTIETAGFEIHEHAMKVLSINVGDQEYLCNFNKEQKQAIFSFDSKQFIPFEEKTSEGSRFLIYLITGCLIILIVFVKKFI